MVPVSEMRKEIGTLRNDIADLQKEEALLDEYNRLAADMLRDVQCKAENRDLTYITHDDIRRLPSFDGETLIAIRAPSGTSLEVPDPDEVRTPSSAHAYPCTLTVS